MSNKDKRILISEQNDSALLNVGHGNFILTHRIVAILESGSLPIKRLRERAGSQNRAIDATAGRKMRSLVITDSNHVIISAVAPKSLQERLREGRMKVSQSQLEWEEGEFVS